MDEQSYLKLLRVYKHDFLNYLQVISGYLQLKKYDSALNYVRQAIGEVEDSGAIMRLNLPELVIWLLVQRLELEEKGIILSLQNDADFTTLKAMEPELLNWLKTMAQIITETLEELPLEQREWSIGFDGNGPFEITLTLPALDGNHWPCQLEPCLGPLNQWEADYSFVSGAENFTLRVVIPTKE